MPGKKKKSVREKQEKQQLPFKSVGVTGRKSLGLFDGASSGAAWKCFTQFCLLGSKRICTDQMRLPGLFNVDLWVSVASP